MQDQGTPKAAGAGDGKQAGHEQVQHRITVLSAMVLRLGRAMLGDSQEVFAARAGADLDVVTGIETETRPAWDVPGPELTPIADALRPVHGEAFWTAVACDLLLTNLLSGDDATAGVAANEILGDPARQQVARKLLLRALGEAANTASLLSTADRALVRNRAAKLAQSRSSDAWVGQEILTIFGGAS